MESKRCGGFGLVGCRKKKSLTQYYKNSRSLDGKQTYCKDCQMMKEKKRRKKYPLQAKQYQKRKRDQYRKAYQLLKKTVPILSKASPKGKLTIELKNFILSYKRLNPVKGRR